METPDDSAPTTTREIDTITLELFTNKKHYKKILSTVNPEKHAEVKREWTKLQKYRGSILNLTETFLSDVDLQVSVDVNDAFLVYARTLIRHFQQKEIENRSMDDDDEVLFGQIQEDEPEYVEPDPKKSFWGKERVVKRGSRLDPFSFFPNAKTPIVPDDTEL
jgi:hypothetical protein